MTDKSKSNATLAERMAAVMGRLAPPPKNGRMVLQNKPIPYVQNDDLMDCLRPALAAEGVAYHISVNEVRKGLADPVGVLLDVRLACAGETLEARAYGEGRTFPIAQTYAVKYWLLRTFLVGSGGEDDEIANAHAQEKSGGQAAKNGNGNGNGAERRVQQNGNTRQAPATAYRDDEGRRAMMRQCLNLLHETYGQDLPQDEARSTIRSVLLGLAEDQPGMVPLVDGEPDLRKASNDQIQRLTAWVEAQRNSDAPF